MSLFNSPVNEDLVAKAAAKFLDALTNLTNKGTEAVQAAIEADKNEAGRRR